MPHQRQRGTITHVNDRGLAYVSNHNGQTLGFTFDKIANYRGQQARELGLREGSHVRFDETDGRVQSVEIER